MATRRLNETFELLGEWFLPTNHEQRIGGVLSYKAGRIELRLNRAFVPMRGAIRMGAPIQQYDLVYGTTTDGEAVTIMEAVRIGASLNFGSGGVREPEHLFAQFLLIGGFVSPERTFTEMRFRIPGLEVWLSRPAIERILNQDESSERTYPNYRIVPFDRLETSIESLGATIVWGREWKEVRVEQFTSIAVDIFGWFWIRSSSPQAMRWYFEQHLKVMAMLTFLAGKPMPPDHVETTVGDRRDVSVMVGLQHSDYCPYRELREFFIPCGAMHVGLDNVVARWFEIHPKVSAAAQLALSVLASSENLWIHVEFLSLMQALEGFHRALWEGTYMENGAYRTVESTIANAIPSELDSDHKASLLSRIKYGNEISLRKRLRTLAEDLSNPLRAAVLGVDGKVPSRWIDTRNYYTHWDSALREKVLDVQGMHEANIRLRHFLRALYLKLMGIPEETILRALRNYSEVSEELSHLNAAEERRNSPGREDGAIATITEKEPSTDDKPSSS